MLNKTIKTFFCLIVVVNFSRFGSEAPCEDLNLSDHQKSIKNMASSVNTFGFRLINQLALEESKNIVISPFCISHSFAVIYMGTQKETRKEIETVFNFENSKGLFHRTFSDLSHNILRKNSQYNFTISNTFYIDNGSKISPEYKKNIVKDYDIFIENSSFKLSNSDEILGINGSIENSTSHTIKQFLYEENIKDTTKIVLTCAAHMKGKWLKPFDPRLTTLSRFKSTDGTVTDVPTMSLQSVFNFAESYDFYSIEIPYESTQTTMLVILPKKRFNFVLENIESIYSYIQETSEPSMINLKLPKFKIESDISTLQRSFTAMGMKHFFGNKPDFSGMSEEKDFSFGEIYHKGYLEVNEYGTEASTAVAMIGSRSSFLPKMRVLELNQPFIVVIRDTKTSQILFVGAVRKL